MHANTHAHTPTCNLFYNEMMYNLFHVKEYAFPWENQGSLGKPAKGILGIELLK